MQKNSTLITTLLLLLLNVNNSQAQTAHHSVAFQDPIPINDIVVGENGQVWVGLEHELYQTDNQLHIQKTYQNGGIYTLAKATNNDIWAAYKPNRIRNLNNSQQKIDLAIDRSSIINHLMIDGNYLFAATTQGLYVHQLYAINSSSPQKWEHTVSNSKLQSNHINFVHQSQDTTIWVGTASGLYRYNLQKHRLRRVWLGKISYHFTAIAENDRYLVVAGGRKIWYKEKFNKHKGWQRILKNKHLQNSDVEDLLFDQTGNLWIASHKLMKASLQQNTWQIEKVYNQNDGYTSTHAFCLALQDDGTVLVGTAGKGLFYISGKEKKQEEQITSTITPDTVVAIQQIRNKQIDSKEPEEVGTVFTTKPIDFTKTNSPSIVYKPNSNIPARIDHKQVETNVHRKHSILLKEPKATLKIWDFSTEDGDTISLLYNGEWILEKHCLTKQPKHLDISIRDNPDLGNYLIVYVNHAGKAGDCSIKLEFDDGIKKTSKQLELKEGTHWPYFELSLLNQNKKKSLKKKF